MAILTSDKEFGVSGIGLVLDSTGALATPKAVLMVAAMNPCPCGYYGDSVKPCSCAPSTVTKYQKWISGPLLDRIDIHIEVPRVDYEKLSGDRLGETSETIRAKVQTTRDIQRERFGLRSLQTSDFAVRYLQRGYARWTDQAILCLADLAGSDEIQPVHPEEALHLRSSEGYDRAMPILPFISHSSYQLVAE